MQQENSYLTQSVRLTTDRQVKATFTSLKAIHGKYVSNAKNWKPKALMDLAGGSQGHTAMKQEDVMLDAALRSCQMGLVKLLQRRVNFILEAVLIAILPFACISEEGAGQEEKGPQKKKKDDSSTSGSDSDSDSDKPTPRSNASSQSSNAGPSPTGPSPKGERALQGRKTMAEGGDVTPRAPPPAAKGLGAPCCICLDVAATYTVKHRTIAHKCLCNDCAEDLKAKGPSAPCPLCRRPQLGLVRVFDQKK